ncbi:MAG: alpha/beta hydrolase [Flavobacteriaceae bacterium]
MNTVTHFKTIDIQVDSIVLKGNLRLADHSKGLVIFSHGSGSSRFSSRNNYVAELLLEANYSSLLFDLLTIEEDMIYENRFDIPKLIDRLVKVTEWTQEQTELRNMSFAYFGASTGAASALGAASMIGSKIKAVVSRGGRPDLAMEYLTEVRSPTLLIVGGEDEIVLELNKNAQAELDTICELIIIEGATHLFPEPGKLERVAQETIQWFDKYL